MNLPVGYYQLFLNDTNRLDFIINQTEKKVDFVFTQKVMQKGVKVSGSEENQVLWDYKEFSRVNYEKLKQLTIRKSYLNKTDTAYQNIERKEKEIAEFKSLTLKNLIAKYPTLYFSRVVKASLPIVGISKEDIKRHRFDNINFKDEGLIRSTILPNAMMDYLLNHTDYNEQGFGNSIDTILSRAKANSLVYDFCLNYLLELFNRVGPDVVFDYLINKYVVEDGCGADNIKLSFKNKASEYAALMVGKKAPDFELMSSDGARILLSKQIKLFKSTILFFWSSHCTFCHKAIEELNKLSVDLKRNGYQILSVSLDNEEKSWKDGLKELSLGEIALCDFKGWESEVVKKFKIHKTPGFILLNAEMIIISKPGNIEILKSIITGEAKK